ncbi:uncharacterized protein LOC107998387 isoform X1 [Apis cerana]|uniref:uncharacterized protein LOC107998387 isoform X1 n=2 Tax=Apis cerana TaxID=7461 RepID=UPI0007E2D619|nr:uncharacterized protein LOC107998387 isoform X1 [Apis cerana]
MIIKEIGFFLLIFPVHLKSSDISTIYKMNPNFLPVPICNREHYCEENTLYYPDKIISQELEKNPHFRYYASTNEIIYPEFEDKSEEESLCISREQIIFPKSGLTKELEWKYIVNHINLTQAVHTEICLEKDRPCRIIEGFAEGYYTKCKQKFIYHQLLAVASNGSIIPELFRFPTNCYCHIDFESEKFLRSLRFNN